MTDAPVSPRRRDRKQAPRSTGPSLTPLPRLTNPWAPLEILSAEQVERILDAAFRVLEEAGLEIRSAAARDEFRHGGAVVDDETQMVRLGRDVVEAHLTHVPESFVLHARNPGRHLHVGGNVVNFGPVNGAPNISDLENGRRYGDLQAFRNILKLTHTLGILHWQGGIVVEPVDVPVSVRHLATYSAHIECADIVWAARGVGGVQAQDAIAMSAIEHGCSVEDLALRPTLMTVTNVNSPRRVDEEILDNIMIMARHGQCVVITPFTLMGAMAPITLAGALVQQTAESLAIITLCQMLRPGTPCVMGGFTSNVDMRTGSPAFGTPEYVNAVLAGAQIGRRLKIPVRTSAVNASPGRRCAVHLRDGVFPAGGDPQSQPFDQSCGRVVGRRTLSVIGKSHRRCRAVAQLGGDAQTHQLHRRRPGCGRDFRRCRRRAFFRRRPYARPLPVRLLSAAVVGLVELRKLDRCRRAQCHAAGHRHLEKNAGGLRATAVGSRHQGWH